MVNKKTRINFFIEGKKPQKGTLELPPIFELPLPHEVARLRG
ncbi:MAG: hypothetical protein ACP5PS_02835 [Bacteroidales bacterium]